MAAEAKAFFDTLPPHVRPVAILSTQEARQKADKIRHELFVSWHRLKDIVLAHEETIQKRWKKRTAVKRKHLLQDIDPNLPKEHAPEISALGQGQSGRQTSRNDFMLPYLNLEDLSVNNGTQFLGLLHARVHHSPSEFAWFDNNVLHFGIVAGAIQRSHGLDCGMIAFGDETTYGRVLEYSEPLDKSDEDSPDGGQMEHNLRESMSFGDGLAVLETQRRLLEFLLAVVSKILFDLELTELSPAPLLAAPEIPILNTAFQWQSSARLNSLRPYGPPPVFSIDDMAGLLESQYELAIQHVVDLRTDPMYLAETIQSYYDHRLEAVHGKAPPALIQNRAVGLMLSDAYTFLAGYHVATAIVDEFRAVQTQFPNGPPRARELPTDYENALMKFHSILGLIETHLTKVHRQTLCSSSALETGRDVSYTDSAFAKNQVKFNQRPEDKLYTYVVILLQGQQTHLWQVARIFDQLDRITQDPTQHQRISPLIANLLSHWGVVNDCKSILDWHRPAVEASESVEDGLRRRFTKWHPLLTSIIAGASPQANLTDKAFPVSRFVYPKGPRDASWALRCQGVDEAFAAFWTTADRSLATMCGEELFALGTRIVAPFVVAPTNWVVLGMPKPLLGQRQPTAMALEPFGGAIQTPAAQKDVRTVKEKPKTRGIPDTRVAAADPAPGPVEDVLTTLRTPVSARAYKVFAALFTAMKDEQIAVQQTSIAWKDIQTAFAQLNFALHKTRGSAWTFRHPDGQLSITVHEPHPEPTMRFWEARRFGRRLTRRFGWTLESFVLDAAVA